MQFTLRDKGTDITYISKRYSHRILGYILTIILLSGCENLLSRQNVNWLYIIPDQYEGWIVIQYDCAGGTPLEEKDNIIRVEFDSDGRFCTTDSFSPWTGRRYAQSTSGDQIPVYAVVRPETGYAVCCGGVMGVGDNTIGYDWVGDLEKGWPDRSTVFRE